MARTVFIMGAGCSVAAGAPLMKDFLRVIRDSRGNLPTSEFDDDFELVLKGYQALQPAYAKLRMNYEESIEELFATFEMTRILNLKQLNIPDGDQLSLAMRRSIAATIEHKMLFDVSSKSPGGFFLSPHYYYSQFVQLLNDLHNARRPDSSICLITFNYDIGLDYALANSKAPFGYCVSEDDANLPYLKLHGSLNWARCSNCESIVPYHLDAYAQNHPLAPNVNGKQHLLISKCLGELEHCGTQMQPDPFIIPPTWNKTEYHRQVSLIWKRAAKELSEASNIIVMGYSLPSTGQFFRHLLALSVSQGNVIDQIVFVNTDSISYKRFKDLFSESVVKNMDHQVTKFEESFVHLRGRLKLAEAGNWRGSWESR